MVLGALLSIVATAQQQPQPQQPAPRFFSFPILSALQDIQCNRVTPSPVLGLQAIPETNNTSKMTLTWTRPQNNPCFVKYEVAVFDKSNASSGAALQVITLDTVSTVIEGLQPGKEYFFSVKALVPTLGASDPQMIAGALPPSVTASNGPTNNNNDSLMMDQPAKSAARLPILNWTCEPNSIVVGLTPSPSSSSGEGEGSQSVGMSYPWCTAAQSGLCSASSCESLAAQGLCSSPLLKKVDWSNRKITQHCAEHCPCEAMPSLRDSLRPVGDDVYCDIVAGQYWLGPDGKPTNGLQF